jgi:hypothetical protein
MSEEHRKRAIEWYLYLHNERPVPPTKPITAEDDDILNPYR